MTLINKVKKERLMWKTIQDQYNLNEPAPANTGLELGWCLLVDSAVTGWKKKH